MINLNALQLDNKKIALIILVAIIVFYVDYSFIIVPQLKGSKGLGLKIKKIKVDLDNFSRESARLQQEKTKKDAGLKGKKIMTEEQISVFLDNISSIANKNSVRIMQIIPSKELKAKDEKTSLDIKKLSPYLIKMDLSCDYHHLGAFLNNLENAEEFIAVEEIKIVPDPGNYLLEKINLVLKTYVKK